MSIEGKTLAGGGTPTYITRFDGVRVLATDYHPVWLDSLATRGAPGRAPRGRMHWRLAVVRWAIAALCRRAGRRGLRARSGGNRGWT